VPLRDARAGDFPLGAAVTLAELDGNPHAVLARLRATEPVTWLPVVDAWLVTSYALVTEVMRDPVTYTVDDPRFSTGVVVGPSMLSLDGPEHARHRAPFVAPFLRSAVATRLESVVRSEVDHLLTALRPAGKAELRTSLAAPLSVAAMSHALGLDATPAAALRWYAAIVGDVSALSAGQPAPGRGREAIRELRAAVDEAGSREGTVVAGALAELGPDEVASNVAVLLFGGIETTEATIATVFAHLVERPDELARVREDPSLASAACEESLRLEPAATVLDRYTTCAVELAGARIGEGELLRLSLAAANRDPAVFCEPDRYDLDRTDGRRHVTFAQGPHVCIGLHLARLEAELALTRALEVLPGLRGDPARPWPEVRGLVFRKPSRVDVVWNA
jgi:cytochrome P450